MKAGIRDTIQKAAATKEENIGCNGTSQVSILSQD